MLEGGGNYLRFGRTGWDRKEGRGNKIFKRIDKLDMCIIYICIDIDIDIDIDR